MLLIREYANPTWLEYHSEWEFHGQLQPALDERPKQMAVSEQDDVAWLLGVHDRFLDGVDVLDKTIHALRQVVC